MQRVLVINDCVCESDAHEIAYYPRKGLDIKSISAGTVCEYLSEWSNFYGTYVRVMHEGLIHDIDPKNIKKDFFGNIDFDIQSPNTVNVIEATVCDGKYKIVFDEQLGSLKAYRNKQSEVWRDLTGDSMVLAMLFEIQALKELNQKLQNKLNQE